MRFRAVLYLYQSCRDVHTPLQQQSPHLSHPLLIPALSDGQRPFLP